MKDTNRNKRIKDYLSCAIIKMWASFTPTRFYEDNTNMDVEKEWISFSSNYISDKEAPSLLAENSSLILKVFKKSLQKETLMGMLLMHTFRVSSHILQEWCGSLTDPDKCASDPYQMHLVSKNRCLTLSTNGTISSNKK